MQDGGFCRHLFLPVIMVLILGCPPALSVYFWGSLLLLQKLYPFSVKNSVKVLSFEKMYLLLRCILSKVKNNIN